MSFDKSKYSLYTLSSNAGPLKIIFEPLKELLDDIALEFYSPDHIDNENDFAGIKVSAKDKRGSTLVIAKFFADSFKEFYVSEKKVSVNLNM